MALQPVLLDAMLDAAAAEAVTASLHTADPGATGTAEVTGGTYARQSITWSSASGGQLDSSAPIVFDVPGGTTVTHLGLWNGSTWLGGIELSTPETYGAAGTYTVSLIRLTLADTSA